MQLPYGLWQGKISADLVAGRGRVSTLRWNNDGSGLFFTAKSKLYKKTEGEPVTEIFTDRGVYGSVGYGGGDFTVHGDLTVFCSGSDGLFRMAGNSGKAAPLTNDRFDRSTPVISPDGKYTACVTSDGEHDQIALLGLKGYSWPRRWIFGADFYMQPEWAPDGKHFAWAEWDHPEMPWSGARVMLAEYDPETMDILSVKQVGGGTKDPASQPHFSPDGKRLAWVDASGDWEDLICLDLATGEKKVLIHGDGFAFSVPAFTQDNRSFAWMPDSRRIAYISYKGSKSEIHLFDPERGGDTRVSPEHLTSFEQLCVSPGGSIAAIAAGPLDFSQVIVIRGGKQEVIYRVNDLKLDASFVSLPREISWKTKGGATVYALYYPPCNPDYSWHGAPPAIVQIHGGPTGKADQSFSAETAYFTSLGYAYVRLNYRGSAGYGRRYLESLNGHWGEYDTEDAVTLAEYLGKEKLADPARLLITGGSSGGFTVLNVLTQYPEVYAAGASLYGVSDLYGLASSTWKLELHYTESLVGTLPEAEKKYNDWSPLFHAEEIRVPLAIFQGDKDVVVPKAQSEGLLTRIRVPHVFRLYEGEGHGFRKPENIRDYLLTLHQFLQQYL